MPNWCTNNLIITGKSKDLQKLMEKAKGEVTDCDVFCFRPFIEFPSDYSEEANGNWYNYRLEHLGCKWFPDIDNDSVSFPDFDKGENDIEAVTMNFESPWSPPTGGVEAVKEWMLSEGATNFSITHSYEENGSGFCGVSTFSYSPGDMTSETQDGEMSWVDFEELTLVDGEFSPECLELVAEIMEDYDLDLERLKELFETGNSGCAVYPLFYAEYADEEYYVTTEK